MYGDIKENRKLMPFRAQEKTPLAEQTKEEIINLP